MYKKIFVLFCSFLIGLLFLFPFHNTEAESTPSVSYPSLVKVKTKQLPSNPVLLSIPAIHLSASIEPVGLNQEFGMDVPSQIQNVGWYKYGVRPGEKGNAVIDGHLDSADGSPAIFWNLDMLRPNDTIYIEDDKGRQYRFSIKEIKEYSSEAVPLATIFTKSLSSNLTLITCAGVFNNDKKAYSKRLLVNAILTE